MLDGSNTAQLDAMEQRLLYLARRRYRISADVAADLVQATMLTFLEVRHRYKNVDEHPRILVGIFRNRCRDHIEVSVRAARRLRELRTAAEAGTADIPVIRGQRRSGGVVEDLIRSEEGHQILVALAGLRPPAREMFRMIIEENLTRQQVIDRLGLLPATVDSRLHTYRNEFKRVLTGLGIRATARNGTAKKTESRPARPQP